MHQPVPNPVYLVSWELTVNCAMTWHFYDEWVKRQVLSDGKKHGLHQNRQQIFIEKMFQRLEVFTRPKSDGTKADTGDAEATQDVTCVIPDAVAVAIAVNPELIQDSLDTFVTVELQGRESRGMTCIDWYGTDQSMAKRGRWRNCKVILKADVDVFLSMMDDIVRYDLDSSRR
jgi:purine nucleosidase